MSNNELAGLDCLRAAVKDYERARELLEGIAPEEISADGLYALAIIHYMRYQDRPVSMEKGLAYSLRAADKGSVQGAYTAAHQLLKGYPAFSEDLNGILRHPDEASVMLGFMPYPEDVTTGIDGDRGLALLERATEAMNANACELMARQLGGAGETNRAVEYLIRAERAGSTTASLALASACMGKQVTGDFAFITGAMGGSDPDKAITRYYANVYRNYPVVVPEMLSAIFSTANPLGYQSILEQVYDKPARSLWGPELIGEFVETEQAKKLDPEDILGVFLLSPFMERDLDRAFGYLDAAYRAGRKTGYTVYLLGTLYLAREGGPGYDPVRAHKLFMEAADLGCAPAAAIAGKSCTDGGRAFLPAELSPDRQKAEMEAAFHVPSADAELGLRDPARAQHYLRQAADAGYARCASELGAQYVEQGRKEEALHYLCRAAILGDWSTSLELATRYAGSESDAEVDFGKSILYCELADMQNRHHNAFIRLAHALEPANPNAATREFIFSLYDRAAGTSREAFIKVAFMLWDGSGCEQDRRRAAHALHELDGMEFADDDGVDHELEIRCAEVRAEIYNTTEYGLHNPAEAENQRGRVAELKASRDETQGMIDQLLGGG